MGNKAYDKYLVQEWLDDSYSCTECGYRRGMGHHKGIRCPISGRCGNCGNVWPCEDCIDMVPKTMLKKVNRDSYVKKSS